MRTGEGFLLVYDITKRSTFEGVSNFRNQIHRVKDSTQVPMILVGNKCDLEGNRVVSTQDGRDLAKMFNIPFLETSAKSRKNVDEAFFTLVREIRKFRQKSSSGVAKGKKGKCTML